jgi:hypothetical protein
MPMGFPLLALIIVLVLFQQYLLQSFNRHNNQSLLIWRCLFFDYTDPSIKYPTLRVPTQAEFDEAVRAEKQAQEDEKAEKSRGLPDAPDALHTASFWFLPPLLMR